MSRSRWRALEPGLLLPALAIVFLQTAGVDATAQSQRETIVQRELKSWPLAADFSPSAALAAFPAPDESAPGIAMHQDVKLLDLNTGRETLTMRGTAGPVHVVRFSPDGRRLAVGYAYTTVKVWDVSNGRELRALTGHSSYVTGLAFHPNGRVLASSASTNIYIWNLDSGTLQRTLTGHTGVLHDIAFSPDGRLFASASYDKTVRLWDAESGKVLRTLPLFPGGVAKVTFSPDSKWLAVGGGDGVISLWDPATGKQGEVLRGHRGSITLLAFTPDARRLASHTWREPLKIWDVATGREEPAVEGTSDNVKALRFDAKGRFIVFEHLLSGNAHSLRIWQADQPPTVEVAATDEPSGPELFVQSGHVGGIWAIAFSPDGKRLASGGQDKKIVLWDTRSWLAMRSLVFDGDWVESLAFDPQGRWLAVGQRGNKLTICELRGHGRTFPLRTTGGQQSATAVAFTPDGRHLISGQGDRKVIVWEVGSWNPVREFSAGMGDITAVAVSADSQWLAAASIHEAVIWDLRSGETVRRFQYGGNALAFSADGKVLAIAPSARDNHGFDLYETATGKLKQTLGGFSWAVWGLAFSRDGRWLAAGGGSVLKVWEMPSLREVIAVPGATADFIEGVAFSPDARWVSVAGRDSRVRVWQMPDGGSVRPLSAVVATNRKLAFSPDGRWLAAGAGGEADVLQPGDSALRLWDAGSGLLVHRLPQRVDAVAFAPDSRTVAVGNLKGDVGVWEADSGRRVHAFVMPQAGHDPVFSVAISPDGSSLAAGYGGGVRLWNLQTGQDKADYPGFVTADAVAFTPDNRHVVAGGVNDPIRVFDTASAQPPREISAKRESARDLAVSPDGRWLAETAGGNIRLRDLPSGRVVRAFAGSQGVLAVALSPDARWLASGGADRTVRLWDTASGRELKVMTGHTDAVIAVAFHPSGRVIASASNDGTIRLWSAPEGSPLALMACIADTMDWVIATPDGLFDGSPDGIRKLVAWRYADSAVPLELYFNEFYSPGLLADILAGKRPKAPKDIAQLDRRQPLLKLALAPSTAPAGAPGNARNVTLRIEVTDAAPDAEHPAGSGARDLRLFRNGSLVKLWRGDVLAGKRSAVHEAPVTLVAGPNDFTAYAFNRDNVKSADASLAVNGSWDLRRRGTAYVIAVGINRYANADYNLQYAVADAQAVAAEFERQQKPLNAFEKVEVVALLDAEATKANMLAALQRLAGASGATAAPPALAALRPAQPEDVVLVHFAGHGTSNGPRFYLIPHDLGYMGKRTELDEAGLRDLLQHSISDRELEQAFEKIDAGRIVLVIDACNSGQALEAEEKRRGPMNSRGLAQLAYEKGMYILTAAQGYQAAMEVSQLGHGYLTFALVEEGLKTPVADSSPKDGRVILREWLDYATARVPQMQQKLMVEAGKLGRNVAFVEGEQNIEDPGQRNLQRPRVFYRREPESEPLVVARP